MDAPRRHAPASDNPRRHAPATLRNRDPILTHSPEQERIVRLLVERVVVSEAGAEITLKLDGIAGLARDLMSRPPEMRRAA